MQKQLRRKLDEMSRQDAATFSHQALKGEQFKGLYKLRAGDWRLIYQLRDAEVVFITPGHRSEVYS